MRGLARRGLRRAAPWSADLTNSLGAGGRSRHLLLAPRPNGVRRLGIAALDKARQRSEPGTQQPRSATKLVPQPGLRGGQRSGQAEVGSRHPLYIVSGCKTRPRPRA